jgi:hypothetical protein
MRFTQAEYCLEVRIIGDTILAIMMEGSFNVFSIKEGRMVAQHKLASLLPATPEAVSAGSSRLPISWFGMDGRHMVVSTMWCRCWAALMSSVAITILAIASNGVFQIPIEPRHSLIPPPAPRP